MFIFFWCSDWVISQGRSREDRTREDQEQQSEHTNSSGEERASKGWQARGQSRERRAGGPLDTGLAPQQRGCGAERRPKPDAFGRCLGEAAPHLRSPPRPPEAHDPRPGLRGPLPLAGAPFTSAGLCP